MKKIITYCLIALIQMSIVLSACGHEIPDTPNETSEHTSSIVSLDESSEPESNEIITAIPFDYSKYSRYGEQSSSELAQPLVISSLKDYFDFENRKSSGRHFYNQTHDSCICGSVAYNFDQYYDEELDFEFAYGYLDLLLSDSEGAKYSEFWRRIVSTPRAETNYLPYIYLFIKEFDINRFEFEFAHKQLLKEFETDPEADRNLLTDRQIELLFGGYSEETIKKELKNGLTFYFEGVLYREVDFRDPKIVDDETLKRMLADESFFVYLYDLKVSIGGRNLMSRINYLLNESENVSEPANE